MHINSWSFAIVFVLGYGAFTIWTVRRLLLVPFSNTTVRLGVRGFGLAFWAAMTVVFTINDAGPPHNTWLRAAYNAFVMLPVSLWAGYWWGRSMAKVFGGGRETR